MEKQRKTVAQLPQLFSDNERYMALYSIRNGRSQLQVHSLRSGRTQVWLLLPITLSEAARLDPYYSAQVDFSTIWYFACTLDFTRPLFFFLNDPRGMYFEKLQRNYLNTAADYTQFKQDLAQVLDKAAHLDAMNPQKVMEL